MLTGYLSSREVDYPIYRGSLIKTYKGVPKSLKDTIRSFIEQYHTKLRENAPICSVICETFIIFNHTLKTSVCYGFYKVNGLTWAPHVWINLVGTMIDLRAVYENYFNQNSISYTDVKLAFFLDWVPGDYTISNHETDYLDKNTNKINRSLTDIKIKNFKKDNSRLKKLLTDIKSRLFDADEDVKSSFNQIISYFDDYDNDLCEWYYIAKIRDNIRYPGRGKYVKGSILATTSKSARIKLNSKYLFESIYALGTNQLAIESKFDEIPKDKRFVM